ASGYVANLTAAVLGCRCALGALLRHPSRVGCIVFEARHLPETVLGHIEHEPPLAIALGFPDRLEWDDDSLFADAEKNADADYEASNLTRRVDQDVVDLADLGVVRIVHRFLIVARGRHRLIWQS